MGEIYGKLFEEIGDAEKKIFGAEHLVFVVFPVVKDAKLLLCALEELHKGVIGLIGVALKFEYLFKRIELTQDKKENLKIFFERVALKYGLNEREINGLKEIIELGKRHKESGFEFSKWGDALIMSDELEVTRVDAVKLKELLKNAKKLLEDLKIELKKAYQKGI